MLNQIKNFMLDESGLETVEWAIVAGVIAAGAAVIFFAMGTDVGRGLGNLGAETVRIPWSTSVFGKADEHHRD